LLAVVAFLPTLLRILAQAVAGVHLPNPLLALALPPKQKLSSPMIVGILLFQAVACAVLSGIVANNKNRDPVGWSILGFLFGLFGFVAALVVEEVEPKRKQRSGEKRKRSSTDGGFDPDEHEKKCPMCAEYIKLEARRCKHCGYEFSEEEVEQQIEERKEEKLEPEQTEQGGTTKSSEQEMDTGKRYAIAITTFLVLMIVALLIGVLSGG